MTRVLSELLGAREPAFRQGVASLEKAHGHPSADIRLTSEVSQIAKVKIRQLGLDPSDTTPEEFYQALEERVKADDKRLEKRLRTLAATYVSAEGDVVAGMAHALRELPINKDCFALKASVAKTMLKKQPPKRAMKQLGYRSAESMLKHESVATLLAAAWLLESPAWRRTWTDRYKTLTPRDFESRQMTIAMPSGRKWQSISASVVASRRHNLIVFKEVGAIVLLPLPADKPSGSATATLALALHALNDIRASSTFLKLYQVSADYGRLVQAVALGEPYVQTHLLDQAVPWHLVQRFYARAKHLFNSDVFEPHLQAEDISWHSVEQVLSHIEPSFEFWHGTSHVALQSDHETVSCNVLDAALNHCNNLSFVRRIVQYGRSSLMQELMLRYLKHDVIERAVTAELQPALAEEELLV